MGNYYRRHLPHYQPQGAIYFVTFRLAGSLPAQVLMQLLYEREEQERKILTSGDRKQRIEMMRRYQKVYFEHFDSILDQAFTGSRWLQEAEIAQIVQQAIEFRDGTKYDLYAYCIMPNHVHLVFELPANDKGSIGKGAGKRATERIQDSLSYPATNILGSLKKHTALEANRRLGRRGAFWQDESYDHVVRDGDELERILWYVILNPEKAGLVNTWKDWKWTYCKSGLLWL